MKFFKQRQSGFSLLEILLVLAIFTTIIFTISSFAISGLGISKNSQDRLQALDHLQEMTGALELNKNDLWQNLIDNTNAGTKHLVFNNNKYVITDGEETLDIFKRGFAISTVNRNSAGDIVTTGGEEDPDTRLVSFYVNWTTDQGVDLQEQVEVYYSNWNSELFEETAEADFVNGTFDDTVLSTFEGGAIQLDQYGTINGDWCDPSLTTTFYDIPGTTSEKSVNAIPGNAFLGTDGDSSGVAFTKLDITGVDPPVISVAGTFDGYNVYDIFGVEDYAYLATDDDNREVVILDISTEPYQEVGYFNAPWWSNARTVAVDGDLGLVGQGTTLRSFDLSQKTGSRPQLDSISVAAFYAYISKVQIVGDYAFVVLYNDWYEMVIVDISDPSNMQEVAQAEVNYSQVSDVFIREDGNRAYFGTTASSSYNEFFILNTTNKSGILPIVSSFDTAGMTVNGITVINDKAILVGNNGEEYQVIDISNENSPTKCGGLQLNEGISDVATVEDIYGNAWAYVVTGRESEEFIAILGGESYSPGGDDYRPSGEYTSSVFDTGIEDPHYYYLAWEEEQAAGSDLRFQIRSGDSSNLSGEIWVGPDGTSATYFTNNTGEQLPSSTQNDRYIQYRAYFTSDQVSTYVLESIRINYQ